MGQGTRHKELKRRRKRQEERRRDERREVREKYPTPAKAKPTRAIARPGGAQK